MCAATDAVEKRVAAARRLTQAMQAVGTAEALAAAIPLHRELPYDMAVMLCELDRKEQAQ